MCLKNILLIYMLFVLYNTFFLFNVHCKKIEKNKYLESLKQLRFIN